MRHAGREQGECDRRRDRDARRRSAVHRASRSSSGRERGSAVSATGGCAVKRRSTPSRCAAAADRYTGRDGSGPSSREAGCVREQARRGLHALELMAVVAHPRHPRRDRRRLVLGVDRQSAARHVHEQPARARQRRRGLPAPHARPPISTLDDLAGHVKQLRLRDTLPVRRQACRTLRHGDRQVSVRSTR